MHQPMSTLSRRAQLTVLLLVIGILVSGCQEEPQIRHYTAPRVVEAKQDQAFSELMLLGAMCWVEGAGWFFRMVGPRDRLENQRDAFLAFLKSLQLTAEKASWQLPASWRLEERSVPGRYATLRLGATEEAPELVVVRFPPGQGGDIAGNVNRWRGMVGLPSLSPSEAEKLTRRIKTLHHEFVVVELTGPGKPR